MPVYIAVVIALVAALQGNFGNLTFLVAGIVLAVPAAVRCRNLRVGAASIALAVLAVWEIISSLVSGISAESLNAAGLAAAVLSCYLCVCTLHPYDRGGVGTSLCFLSIIVAVLGMANFAGLLSLGWLDGKHLVYGFGDNNVAAAWFAVMILMSQTLIQRNRFLILSIPFNVVGLLLTCSVLVIALWLLSEAVILLCYKKDAQQMGLLLVIFISCVLGVAFYYLKDVLPAEIAVVVVMAVLAWFAEEPSQKLGGSLAIWVAAVIMVAAVIVGAAFSLRLQVELPSQLNVVGIEISDAWNCIVHNLLFGIGASNWNYLAPFYQSTVYSAAVTPCAFLQMGVEAGIVGLLASLAAVLLGVMRCFKSDARLFLASLLMALTCLFTASLSAFGFCGLFVALAFAQRSARERQQDVRFDEELEKPVHRAVSLEQVAKDAQEEADEDRSNASGVRLPMPAGIAICVVLVACMAVGIVAFVQFRAVYTVLTNQEAEATDVTVAYEGSSYWLQNSPSLRMLYDQWVTYEVVNDSYQGQAIGSEALKILATTTNKNLYDYTAQAYVYGSRYENEKGMQLLYEAAQKAPHYNGIYYVIETYLSGSDVSDELAQEVVDYAASQGYTVEWTPLTKDDRKAYAKARKEFQKEYGGLEDE